MCYARQRMALASSVHIGIILTLMGVMARWLVLSTVVSIHAAAEWNGTWGYVNVSYGKAGGELFYWYFPARSGDVDAPLLLWLQGGPGASSIEDGLLRINGPYAVNEQGELAARNISWNNEFAMLYVDSPPGTGYSTATGYASNQSEVAHMLVQLLAHFTFDALYLCGESYGGHYIPPLGVAVLEAGMPLAGVSIGDGLTDPSTQVVTKPTSAYHFGLVDEETAAQAQIYANLAKMACDAEEYVLAKQHRETMESIILQTSQINAYDVRRFEAYDESIEISFLNSSDTRQQLGAKKYFGTDPQVSLSLTGDVMRTYKQDVKTLIQANVPVLLYQGQFDWKDGATSNEAWIRSLFQNHSYLNANRTVLQTAQGVKYGWIKRAPPLYDAVIGGAGHMAPMDQPAPALDLITRFVRGVL